VNPYIIDGPAVISFSGGRTSGYMLAMILAANDGLPDDVSVVFANTGLEHEGTLKFVDNCAKAFGIHISFVEFGVPHIRYMTFEGASRNGEPFETLIRKKQYLPNAAQRFCTGDLKIQTIRRFMQDHGHDEYMDVLGIRADEPHRIAKMKRIDDSYRDIYMPLAVAGVTKQDVQQFWAGMDFDLEVPHGHGNCQLCFMKGVQLRGSIMTAQPNLANWWIEREDEIDATFEKSGLTYRQVQEYALAQDDLFLDELRTDCYCGD
jgi:3'-phosphoadenosine 5'-phosphosulfate sulfotransferase (PAPS reductase)/FAD synthetase